MGNVRTVRTGNRNLRVETPLGIVEFYIGIGASDGQPVDSISFIPKPSDPKLDGRVAVESGRVRFIVARDGEKVCDRCKALILAPQLTAHEPELCKVCADEIQDRLYAPRAVGPKVGTFVSFMADLVTREGLEQMSDRAARVSEDEGRFCGPQGASWRALSVALRNAADRASDCTPSVELTSETSGRAADFEHDLDALLRAMALATGARGMADLAAKYGTDWGPVGAECANAKAAAMSIETLCREARKAFLAKYGRGAE